MTTRLREALHTAASDVPAYPVYERALATARRTRRRAALTAVAALVLAGVAGTVLPTAGDRAVDAAAGGGAALPDRIALPPPGTLHATDRPRLGPASVLFSGTASRLGGGDEDATVGVVGASSDRYRILAAGGGAAAGERVVLSPDGRYVARPGSGTPSGGPEGSVDSWVDVLDLVDGGTRRVDSGITGGTGTAPLAWSPDGRRLVVEDVLPTDPQRRVLSVVALDGGRRATVSDRLEQPIPGWPVAFAPGGDRIAYQIGRTVTVADLDGRTVSSFLLPHDSGLAGKGAWTADGAVTLVDRGSGPTAWRLRRVDPATGRDTGGPPLPEVAGVTTVRLLGWGPDGSALVVAYQPEPGGADRSDWPPEIQERTSPGTVRSVRVLALTPHASAPRTVLTAPEQVVAVDVADDVVRGGRTRAAHPPGGVGPRFWLWAVPVTVLVAGVAAYLRRVRAARRP